MAEDTGEELVHLDRIGVVPKPGDDLRASVFAPGLPEASRRRFEEDERFTLVEDNDGAATCDVALLSTRNPRGDALAMLETFRTATTAPAVVLAHTGGEATAVELVRQGAVTILGEGDEASLATVLTGLADTEGLLEAYDRNTASANADGSGRGIDPITGLLDELAMRANVEELVASGELPRVAYVRLLNTPRTPRDLSYEGFGALRRRIATQFRHLCERAGADLFAIDDDDFGLVAPDLSPNDAQSLARAMSSLAATFVPTGIRPLAVAFGHCGPEAATDGTVLMELAARARDLAAQDSNGGVVSAELLALGMASSTELASAMRTLEVVEHLSHHAVGHGERVAELAASLATELGYDGLNRSRIRLAAHLHEIGKILLPREAVADPRTLDGELLASYRSHPLRSADFLRPVAGTEVATIVRSYAERWDGAGVPDGLLRHDIPTGARIIAAAHAIEGAITTALQQDASLTAAITGAIPVVRGLAGTVLDPDIAEVAAGLLTSGRLGGVSFTLAV